MRDGKAALEQLDARLAGVFNANSRDRFFSTTTAELTNNRIGFTGIPFCAPFVQAMHGPAGDFLLGGFFPNAPRSQPLPPQLLAELNQSNLVYYHQEISAARMKSLPQLSQFLLMFTRHKQFNSGSVAGKWLDSIAPTLGGGVTEAKQTAPNELTFARSARAGLTAAELLALANWLEAPNFPGCDLNLPRPKIPRLPHPQVPGATPAPAPATPH